MTPKRIFNFSLILIFLCMLCGCIGYEESDSRYIVSALGFDSDGDNISVAAEVIAVGEGSAAELPETRIFTSVGKTPASAVYNLGSSLSKGLLMEHCGVVVLGSGIDRGQMKEIFEYCRKENELNLAVYMITAENATELISVKPLSAITIGYEIMGIIERSTEENGISYSNRFYEAEASVTKVVPIFSLPYFALKNNSPIMLGERIFKDNELVLQLDNEESAVYSFICNSNVGGTIRIGEAEAKVLKSHTFFDAVRNKDDFSFLLNIKLFIKKSDNEFEAELEAAANRLIERSKESGVGDIFGFADRIYKKNSDMWFKIKDTYEKNFASGEIKIICSAGGDNA